MRCPQFCSPCLVPERNPAQPLVERAPPGATISGHAEQRARISAPFIYGARGIVHVTTAGLPPCHRVVTCLMIVPGCRGRAFPRVHSRERNEDHLLRDEIVFELRISNIVVRGVSKTVFSLETHHVFPSIQCLSVSEKTKWKDQSAAKTPSCRLGASHRLGRMNRGRAIKQMCQRM